MIHFHCPSVEMVKNGDLFFWKPAGKLLGCPKIINEAITNEYEERWSLPMSLDLTLQKIAEGIPKSILSASDKDLEGFQKIVDETIKLREGHRNLEKMIKSFSSSLIQRS